jgi:hypothetical protein
MQGIRRDAWASSMEGGKKLSKFERRQKTLNKKIKANTNDQAAATELAGLQPQIDSLMSVKLQCSKSIDVLSRRISKAKADLKKNRKARKKSPISVYSLVEEVLHRHNMSRTSYHSRDFNGVTIKKLMDDADVIMSEVCDVLIKHKKDECTLSEDDIPKMSKLH